MNVVETETKERAKKALGRIQSMVAENPLDDAGLLNGISGQGIYALYWDLFQSNDFETTAYWFDLIQNKLADGHMLSPYMADGTAGIIWYFQHLKDLEVLDDVSAIEPLISTLEQSIELEMNKGELEYLYGAIGMANGLFGTVAEKNASINIITALEIASELNDHGRFWYSDQEKSNVQLTASHGILGIGFFLLKAFDRGIDTERTRRMASEFADYLLSARFEHPDMSLYPYEMNNHEKGKDSKRVAWCYGDLMIGYFFLWAGMSLQNDTYLNEANDILEYSAKRRDLVKVACNDPMICHGSGGVAHIFGRIYEKTNKAIYQETQEYWMDVTLSFLEKSDFKDIYYDFGSESTEVRHSLLEGTSGIGLVLISYLQPDLKDWDASLLFS